MSKENNIYIKKARHKRKVKKAIFIGIIFICVLLAIVFKTDIFTVKNVSVEGDALVTNDYINDTMEQFKGDNILLLRASDVKKELQKNPYIKDIKMTKNFPDTIKLKISESEGLYYITQNNDNSIVGSDCMLLENSSNIKNKNLIQIIGIDISDKSLGDIITDDTRVKSLLQEIYREQQVISNNGEDFSITGIDIGDLSSIKVFMGNIYIIIGNDENFRSKMSDAINIYKTGKVKEYINVSFNGTPDFK